MAFNTRDLSVLAYANGFTLWHYTTEDVAATVNGAGYFDHASPMMNAGDVIYVNTSTDKVVETCQITVTSVVGSSVTTTLI